MDRRSRPASFLLILTFILLLSYGCGGGGGADPGPDAGSGGPKPPVLPDAPPSVQVSPESATLYTGRSLRFTAVVGGSSDTSVEWSLQEGNAAGSITPEGVYTASDRPGTYHVVATSQANVTIRAVATVKVEQAPAVVPGTLIVTPKDPTVRIDEKIFFTAAVDGLKADVTWSLQQGPSAGTITEDGEYTAGSKPGSFILLVTDKRDHSKSLTVRITVRGPATVVIEPPEATLFINATAKFTADILEASDKKVTWRIKESEGGSLFPDGNTVDYTAPGRTGTFHVVATSVEDGSKQGEATVHVVSQVSVAIHPKEAVLLAGEKITFKAEVVGTDDKRIHWRATGGTIGADGVYTAPDIEGRFEVIATSEADPARESRAVVTVGGSGVHRIERVSINSDRVAANGDSNQLFISGDGRVVAFNSVAPNLDASTPHGGEWELYLHDRMERVTKRISVGVDGPPDGTSWGPKIDFNGNYILYESEARNLVSPRSNGFDQLFLYNRATGKNTLVSVDSAGRAGESASSYGYLSANGRYLVFFSFANLTPEDIDPISDRKADIYFRDLATNEIKLISVSSGGVKGNNHSYCPSISDDGRYISYQSYATNLIDGREDTNGPGDIFVYDREHGTTTQVSVDDTGRPARGENSDAKISGDGRFVVIASYAVLVPEDDNNRADNSDLYIYNMATGGIKLVSVGLTGRRGDGKSWDARISRDGRYVAFDSYASDLVENDRNGSSDVFVRDLRRNETLRMSLDPEGKEQAGDSDSVRISADGGFVAFRSRARLVPDDTNRFVDIYVAEIPKKP